jgi:hypothetical protein
VCQQIQKTNHSTNKKTIKQSSTIKAQKIEINQIIQYGTSRSFAHNSHSFSLTSSLQMMDISEKKIFELNLNLNLNLIFEFDFSCLFNFFLNFFCLFYCQLQSCCVEFFSLLMRKQQYNNKFAIDVRRDKDEHSFGPEINHKITTR